jgi:hypothetical protein|tara:strand:+ start:98 stop:475 length:378 start_codon:yes stop_codon:yes gene_type:complete
MNKPNNVKVGWKDIRIEYIEPQFERNNADFWGQFLSRKGVIEIQKEIQGDDLANTLLHEVLHAIVYASSLNSEGGALEDHKDEEQTVNSITNHLMAVIKDNPWFLDFLKEQIKPENQSKHQQKLI